MRVRTSFRYNLHPILGAFYSQWSALTVPGLPLSAPNQCFARLAPALMFYNDIIHSNDLVPTGPATRQILGPLLPIFFWDSPFAVPEGVRWAKCELNDEDVLANLIAEWVRWIVLTGEPLFAELGRQVFNHILSAQQRKQHFGVKTLSQRSWGNIIGLSRAQLARAAATLTQRKKDCQKSIIITAQNDPRLKFFKDRYDD